MKTKSASEVVTAARELASKFPKAVYERSPPTGCGNTTGRVIVDGETVMTGCIVGCAIKQCEPHVDGENGAYQWMKEHEHSTAGDVLKGLKIDTIEDEDLLWLCEVQEGQDGGLCWMAAAEKADASIVEFKKLDEYDRQEILNHL
jgi:hypothetical protein